MTKLKLCGMRRMEDIEIVNRYRPDYVGFIFANSIRKVTPEDAKKMIAELDQAIVPVGVFVNELPEIVAKIAEYTGLKVIQLHGDETPQCVENLNNITGCIIWKAFRIKDEDSVREVEKYSVDAYLADTYTPDGYGGSGKTFRWDLLENTPKHKLILAGGLHPGNIREAIQTVRPYAVDLSSGVETNGYRDENKIKLLIEQMKGA